MFSVTMAAAANVVKQPRDSWPYLRNQWYASAIQNPPVQPDCSVWRAYACMAGSGS